MAPEDLIKVNTAIDNLAYRIYELRLVMKQLSAKKMEVETELIGLLLELEKQNELVRRYNISKEEIRG